MNAVAEMPAPLLFTDNAANKVKALIEEEGNNDLKLRVFVSGATRTPRMSVAPTVTQSAWFQTVASSRECTSGAAAASAMLGPVPEYHAAANTASA